MTTSMTKAWPFGVAAVAIGIAVLVAVVFFANAGYAGLDVAAYALAGFIFIGMGWYTLVIDREQSNSNTSKNQNA